MSIYSTPIHTKQLSPLNFNDLFKEKIGIKKIDCTRPLDSKPFDESVSCKCVPKYDTNIRIILWLSGKNEFYFELKNHNSNSAFNL